MESLPKHKIHELAHFYCDTVLSLWSKQSLITRMPVAGENYGLFRKYCEKMLAITKMGRTSALHSVYLIEKFVSMYPEIVQVAGSCYKLVVVSLMISNKFNDDATYTNKTWATVTGRNVKEINCIEKEFLICLGYSVSFPRASFNEWSLVYEYLKLNDFLLSPPMSPN
jgi:hypothetical protein